MNKSSVIHILKGRLCVISAVLHSPLCVVSQCATSVLLFKAAI